MHRRSLPIASPCTEDFGAMEGRGEASRYCDRCQKSVHDLSAMTRAQARYFLLQHQGSEVCVRYRAAADGTLRFRPPPPMRAAAPMLVVLGSLMAACTGYVEAADLEYPEGPTCTDAAGYPVACTESEAIVPFGEEEVEVETEEVLDVIPPIEQDEGVHVGVDSEIMGGIGASEIEGEVLEPGFPGPVEVADDDPEGCPVRQWSDSDAEVELVGEIMGRIDPDYDRRESRRIEREYRKEQRRERRRSRR